ncbi:hypothetical protein SteCoe_23466 [Stentor coeruleus]|uniref:Uncharacterized protein n=1 Tax=Stentor coeruleus TaxID=5963 RepID=A0A1R2BK86_9CILI|nr:hypothetical protein SteCoe_23466 [Stentor coeruleus]
MHMQTNFFDKKFLKSLIEGTSPSKKPSLQGKISLFSEYSHSQTPTKSIIRLKRYRGITPMHWDVSDEEIKPIQSRSRLKDFTQDSVRHLFSQRFPVNDSSKTVKLPPLQSDDKIYYKKTDNIVMHREALLRLKKQGFNITRR